MSKFLDRLADVLYSEYGDSVSDLCVVLPNRRGGLFLKKYLAARIGKTIWSPEIFSIEDFLIRLSGLTLADNTRLLFELFEVHKEIEGKNARPFEEFISWGQQLLQDFNEIDSYLADPDQLFGFLSEAKAISLWNPDLQPLTDFQQKYLGFYSSLLTYYRKLSERLTPGQQVYTGLLFRITAGMVVSGAVKIPWDKIIFAGFNALTKAEEVIMDTLVSSGKAQLMWDADNFYMQDKEQEAGEFLRKWQKKWGHQEYQWVDDDLSKTSKNITITGIPYNIGQVKYCGEVLSKMHTNGDYPEDTAVVLMDEQLLIPLLNSLPENINALNITMGLSLKQSPLFSFFDALFRLHLNRERFRQSSSEGKIKYYFRDILNILQHPAMIQMACQLIKENRFVFDEMVETLKRGNRIFLSREEIIPVFSDLFQQGLNFLEPLFTHFTKPEDAISCMKKIILQLRDNSINRPDESVFGNQIPSSKIDLEFIYGFSRVIHQVESLMTGYDAVKNLNTLHQVFKRIAENTTLPFYGEPLKGIQIMGMLETRTLDFRNLIMLSVNEDLIPGNKSTGSFIPYDIRRIFHLPAHHHRNAVYAYHFYRLLQRAETVHLVYNTEPDELGGGEKSCFITQIQQELSAINPGIEITDQIISAPPVSGHEFPAIIVDKDNDILDLLKKKAVTGFSPTSLNAYRRCPLQFYFSEVAGIAEQKELEDTIDPQVLGQSVHEALNKLFQPFLNVTLTLDHIDSMFGLVGAAVDKAFDKKYQGADIAYGKNLLLVNVARIMIRNFLTEEKKNIEKYRETGKDLTVRLLEKQLKKTIKISLPDHIMEVNLKGFADRIDVMGQIIRIIDYKSGQVDKKELELNEWTDLIDDPGKDKCFQLLMYAYLLDTSFGISNPLIEAGIISLKRVRSGFLSLIVPDDNDQGSAGINPNALKNFEEILHYFLKEIFNPEIPFDQTTDRDICEKCPFNYVCGR